MKHYENRVCIGAEKEHTYCWHNCPKFDTLTEARAYAERYRDAKVFRVYFAPDTGDMLYIREF